MAKVIVEEYTTTFHRGNHKRYVHHIDYICPICGMDVNEDDEHCNNCLTELEFTR